MFSFLPALAWMSLIFYLSHQPGGESGWLTRWLLDLLSSIGIDLEAVFGDQAVLVLRKTAHFTVYFVLMILVFLPLKKNSQRPILAALFFCLCYAASDEIHQSLVPGRDGNVGDVVIDMLGATAAAFILYLFHQRRLPNTGNFR